MTDRQAGAEEVPLGYKLTEVRVIPEDWVVKSIGDLIAEKGGSSKTGPFGTLLKASEYSTEGVPIVSVGEVGFGKIEVKESTPMAPPSVVKRLSEYCLKPGDIVFGRKGAVERSAIVETHQEGWFLGSDGIRLRLPSSVHPPFIAHQLQSPRICKWLISNAIGTTMASLNQDVLSQITLSLAPLPEQRAIAAALSDVDGLIGALGALIEKKRAIKQAAMQQLLTGKKRLPGFEGEWETKRLGEVASIRNPKILPSNVDPDTLCVELEHIGQGDGRLLEVSTARNSTSSKYRFFTGDVLFGRLRSYLRKFWHADRDGICTTELWPLMVDESQTNSGFLYAVVQSDRFVEAASISYGTHMPRADWGVMQNFEIYLPPLPEQRAIAAVLSDMDAEIAALERRRDKAKQIKQGMMQQLLTGRIQLPPVGEANEQ
jgi:type I restriction enzyme S subunit